MKKHLALLTLATLAVAGCTHGQGEVDVTSTNVATFPGAPPALAAQVAGQAVTTQGSVTVDLKKDLESLGELGSLTAEVSKNGISGPDLGLLDHIEVTIASQDGTKPEHLLSDVDVPKGSTEVEMPLLMSTTELLGYLGEGKATVHFSITGQLPQRELTLTHTMVAHVNVAMSGSILKF